MEIHSLTTGARGNLPLVRDDTDRFELLERVACALGALVLAYCVMTTHLHLVVEGPADHAARWLTAGLAAYLREFNRRHGHGGVLRGPVAALPVASDEELGRAINYVHANPTRTRPPMTERAIDFPWSSQRAFAGLSLSGIANVPRALALLGPLAPRVAGCRPPLADLEPSPTPTASPEVLLCAAADAYGLRPWDLPSPQRSPELSVSRALFLRLGLLEGYSVTRLAPFLNRSQQQGSKLSRLVAVPDHAARIARTLLRDPELRRRLRPHRAPACPAAAE